MALPWSLCPALGPKHAVVFHYEGGSGELARWSGRWSAGKCWPFAANSELSGERFHAERGRNSDSAGQGTSSQQRRQHATISKALPGQNPTVFLDSVK